jgi:hypothetical protein
MRYGLLAAILAALTLQGCGSDSTAPGTGTASLRLASASPDAGALDLLVNGRTVAHTVGHTQSSSVARVAAGTATGEVRASGSAAALATLPLVSVDTSGSGGSEPPPPPVPVDSGTPPRPVDATSFRLVHAAPDAPPLDVYLVPAGAALDTLPTLQPFAYGSLALTADLIRTPGRYDVRYTDQGTTHVVLDEPGISGASGELVTVVLGENADKSLRVDVVRASQ